MAKDAAPSSPGSVETHFVLSLYDRLDEDTHKKYLRIEDDITDRDDISVHLLKLEEMCQFIMDKDHAGFGTDEHRLYFLDRGLPKLTRALLGRTFELEDIVPHVNNFFHSVIDIIILYMDDVMMGLLDTLYRIVDYERQFYLYYGCLVDEDDRAAFSQGKYARCSQSCSAYYVENLNYFGGKGGLDAIVRRLQHDSSMAMTDDTEKKSQRRSLTTDELRAFCDVLVRMRHFLHTIMLEKYVRPAVQAVIAIELNRTEEELKQTDKDTFADVQYSVLRLLKAVDPLQVAGKTAEMFDLQYALKCFKCAFFEKRINGITEINSMIEYTVNRDYRERDPEAEIHTTIWLTRPVLAKWIVDNGVLEELFGARMHVEIVDRGAAVLKFLAHSGFLTTDHVDLIWNASVDKHDAMVTSIYQTIARIVHRLKPNLVSHILTKISAIPVNEINVKVLELVFDLARYGQHEQQNPQVLQDAMELLWTMSQDKTNAPLPIANKARHLLQELLKRRFARQFRQAYIARSVKSLQDGEDVANSLRVCTALLQLFRGPADKSGAVAAAPDVQEMSRRKVIQQLEQQGLLTALFAEFETYCAKAHAAVSKADPSKDPGLQALVGRYTHREELTGRLGFLRYILINCELQLSTAHIDALWRGLIEQHVSLDAQSEAFLFFQRIHWEETINSFDLKGRLHLFHKLGSLDALGMSRSAFACLRHYFLLVNAAASALELAAPLQNQVSMPYLGRVTSFRNLSGTNYIWAVALQAQNEEVARGAASLLIQLHLGSGDENVLSVRETFISECIGVMRCAGARLGIKELADSKTADEKSAGSAVVKELCGRASQQMQSVGGWLAPLSRSLDLLRAFADHCKMLLEHETKTAEEETGKTGAGPSANDRRATSHDSPVEDVPATTSDVDMSTENTPTHSSSMPSSPAKPSGPADAADATDDTPPSPAKKRRHGDSDETTSVTVSSLFETPPSTFTVAVAVEVPSFNETKTNSNAAKTGNVTDPTPLVKQNSNSSVLSTSTDVETSGTVRVVLLRKAIAQAIAANSNSSIPSQSKPKGGASSASAGPSLVLTLDGRELTDEMDILVHEFQDKLVLAAPPPPQLADRITLQQPTHILSNSQHFDLLFLLLSLSDCPVDAAQCGKFSPSQVTQQIWELIAELPINQHLMDRMRSLQSISADAKDATAAWETLLGAASPFRLLYSLRIITQLMDKDAHAASAVHNHSTSHGKGRLVAAVEWRTKFVKRGGLRYVFRLLKQRIDMVRASLAEPDTSPEVAHKVQHQECSSLLLSIANFFCCILFGSTVSVTGTGAQAVQVPSRVWLAAHHVLSIPPKLTASERYQLCRSLAGPCAADSQALDGISLEDLAIGLIDYMLLNAMSVTSDTTQLLKPGLDTHLVSTVESAMVMWQMVLLHRPELFASVFEHPLHSDLIVQTLLASPSQRIRTRAWYTIEALSSFFQEAPQGVEQSPYAFYLNYCKNLLLEDKLDKYTHTAYEFMMLFNSLVMKACQAGQSAQLANVVEFLITRIQNRPILESKLGDNSDYILMGYMFVLRTFVSASVEFKTLAGKSLIKSLLLSLFDRPKYGDSLEFAPPQCKRHATRHWAFMLLLAIATGHAANYNSLCEYVLQLLDSCNLDKWNFDPADFVRSSTGYGGIVNLGCICYMNSLMQQFYMLPKLRNNMLAVECPDEKLDDSLLYQLQTMFGYLKESELKAFNPEDFCHAFKDFDNNPTDVHVQKDAAEFFNLFCDRLQTKFDGLGRTFMKETLVGRIENQMICKGCPHRSFAEEPFWCLSLTVKDKPSLQQSFENYVQGEMLAGDNAYRCAPCNKKVDTLKRVVIKSLPQVLILHLKRFAFDFDAMENLKINDYCEFPRTLDMYPFTKEGIEAKEAAASPQPPQGDDVKGNSVPAKKPDEYYKYSLRGVVIHQGGADSGHYYSLIKEKMPGGGERWLEFNDDVVEPFDVNNIPSEAFGGTEMRPKWIPRLQRYVNRKCPKTRNAYMVVYERTSSANAEEDKTMSKPDAAVVETKLPDPIFEGVWKQNMELLKNKHIFNQLFFDFMTQLALLQPGYENQVYGDFTEETAQQLTHIRVCTDFVTTVLIRSKLSVEQRTPEELFSDWVNYLKKLYETNVPACELLIRRVNDDPSILSQILLNCPNATYRLRMAELFVVVLRTLRTHELSFYDEMVDVEVTTEQDDDEDADDASPRVEKRPRSLVVAFIFTMVELLSESAYSWRIISEYCWLFWQIALLGQEERAVLVPRIPLFIDFYLGNQSPWAAKQKYRRPVMEDKFTRVDLSNLFRMLSLLVCNCRFPRPGAPEEAKEPVYAPTQLQGSMLVLSSMSQKLLVRRLFLMKMIREGHDPAAIGQLLSHMVWENPNVDTLVCEMFLKKLNGAKTPHDVTLLLRTLHSLLQVADSLQAQRIENYLNPEQGLLARMFECRVKYPSMVFHSIQFAFSSLYACCQRVHEYFEAMKEYMHWMVPWLHQFLIVKQKTSNDEKLHHQIILVSGLVHQFIGPISAQLLAQVESDDDEDEDDDDEFEDVDLSAQVD